MLGTLQPVSKVMINPAGHMSDKDAKVTN